MQEREEFSQLDEPFCLLALLGSKLLAIVLAVEQQLKPRLYCRRQLELRQFGRDLDCLRHGSLSWWTDKSIDARAGPTAESEHGLVWRACKARARHLLGQECQG